MLHRFNFYRTAGIALGVATLTLLGARTCYAGPPFQTDDPDPVEFHHFEMYAFELSDSTGKHAGGTVLEVPAYEVNYGAAPGLQLHLVVPMTAVFTPDSGPTNFGVGDTELGAKIRFAKETPHSPEIGIFPFFEFPSGNADRGLGVPALGRKMRELGDQDLGLLGRFVDDGRVAQQLHRAVVRRGDAKFGVFVADGLPR